MQIQKKKIFSKPLSFVLKPSAGFTLVEMLLYMGLLGIFLFVLTDILVESLDLRTDSTAASYVVTDGEYIRHRLQYDIRRSSSIDIPNAPGDSGSELELTIDGTSTTYTLDDGNLILTRTGDASSLNTSSTTVASFSATRVGNGTGKDTVQIGYTLESKALLRGETAEAATYSLTIGTR